MINLVSFGQRWKLPLPRLTKLPINMMQFPNPYKNPALKALSGRSQLVQEYVKAQAGPRLSALVREVAGKAVDGDVIGAYCYSGRHRSVTFIELLGVALRSRGFDVRIEHRDITKGDHGRIRNL